MARGNKSSASLAPGFRFHPTDEELIRYYLKRKVTNKPFRFDPIAVVDIYKSEPWDLPDKSKLKTRDLEWYFFSMLDKKYGNGSKKMKSKLKTRDLERENGGRWKMVILKGKKKFRDYFERKIGREERDNRSF